MYNIFQTKKKRNFAQFDTHHRLINTLECLNLKIEEKANEMKNLSSYEPFQVGDLVFIKIPGETDHPGRVAKLKKRRNLCEVTYFNRRKRELVQQQRLYPMDTQSIQLQFQKLRGKNDPKSLKMIDALQKAMDIIVDRLQYRFLSPGDKRNRQRTRDKRPLLQRVKTEQQATRIDLTDSPEENDANRLIKINQIQVIQEGIAAIPEKNAQIQIKKKRQYRKKTPKTQNKDSTELKKQTQIIEIEQKINFSQEILVDDQNLAIENVNLKTYEQKPIPTEDSISQSLFSFQSSQLSQDLSLQQQQKLQELKTIGTNMSMMHNRIKSMKAINMAQKLNQQLNKLISCLNQQRYGGLSRSQLWFFYSVIGSELLNVQALWQNGCIIKMMQFVKAFQSVNGDSCYKSQYICVVLRLNVISSNLRKNLIINKYASKSLKQCSEEFQKFQWRVIDSI